MTPAPAPLGGYEFEVGELGEPTYFSPPPSVAARGTLIPVDGSESSRGRTTANTQEATDEKPQD